jgi:hypothetical protein
MNENINSKSRYDDLEEFFATKERIYAEIKEEKKIGEINMEINKRGNKLSKITKLVSRDMTTTKQIDSDMINAIKNKINKHDNFSSLQIDIIFTLYLYVLKELDNKSYYYNFGIIYNQFKKYSKEAKDFNNYYNHIKQHNFILLVMKKHLVQNIPLNQILFDDYVSQFVCKSGFNIFNFTELKNETDKLMDMIVKHNDNVIHYFEFTNNIDNKIKKQNIIKSFTEKFIKTYKYSLSSNKPEIQIYNLIVELSKTINEIIFVTLQFTLPVSYIKPLSSDILVVLKINGYLHFCIIEHDGPTHYDFKDYRFYSAITKRDMIKNKFCVDNKISIIRIRDKNKNINNDVTSFILSIIENNGEAQTNIPDEDFYNGLVDSFDKYSEEIFTKYISENEKKIKINYSHKYCVENGCNIYNNKNNTKYVIENSTQADYIIK